MWLGNNNGDMAFRVPDYYGPRHALLGRQDGQKWRSLGNACWFTNLDFAKRHEELILYKTYDPRVSHLRELRRHRGRTRDIPMDYAGPWGCQSRLGKVQPDQFEIIGFSGSLAKPMAEVVQGATGRAASTSPEATETTGAV